MSQSVEKALLQALTRAECVESDALATELNVDHQDVVGAGKSLESDNYITSTVHSKPVWKLTDEAYQIADKGSPEFILWQLLADGEMAQEAIQAQMGVAQTAVAMGNGIKSKLFTLTKRDGKAYLTRHPSTIISKGDRGGSSDANSNNRINTDVSNNEVRDTTRDIVLRAIKGAHVEPEEIKILKKRQLGSLESIKIFTYCKGPSYAPIRRAKAVGDLTREMLQDGSWKETEFKEYNFEAAGAEVNGGQLHPLLKVRQEFREILLELGFQEMDTQHWVESSFWNFDSLFIPQQHPARDVQDTFFLSKPANSDISDRELMSKIKAIHEKSFHGEWKEVEARRNVLRTHTTGTSAFTLYNLARTSHRDESGKLHFRPGRYYSIDRVFRNEEMDRTHLCEFHQVEGFVIDRDISLAKMMHTFDSFFRRIGVERLRFKPAFNPYTEPSMEIFGFHSGLGKWIEVGNSGLFRPELLHPLGFDDDVRVMAWGLSLERPTMIKYKLNSIHELFGHRVDIKFIKKSAIARFEDIALENESKIMFKK